MKVLRTLLPAGSYDNQPDADRIMLADPTLLGSDESLPVYRARLRGKPAAVVLTVVARQGYTGPIRLLVAIGTDGGILGVRTLAHQETPGVGDRIDPSRSDWLGRFRGRALAGTPLERWAVRRDGGDFDQLTGATVTSRAVVNAVRDAALVFEARRQELFERPAE
jgi:electron transport complex protein RnfG